MATDLEISGHKYRVGKLNARTQFHVARKLAPVLSGIGALMKVDWNNPDASDLGLALEAFGNAISKLETADADFILDTILMKCERQADNGSAWNFVYIPGPDGKGISYFPDLDMATELRLAWAGIVENLGPFFGGAVSALRPLAQKLGAPLNGFTSPTMKTSFSVPLSGDTTAPKT